MKRVLYGLYALLSYAIGMASLLYIAAFLLNLVPKGIDGGTIGPLWPSLAANLAILAAFLVPHSIMARPGFKRRWTRIVPAPLERATYILVSGITLLLALWAWRPIPVEIWSADTPLVAGILYAIYGFGWAMIVISTFSIDHFAFFGLRQVWASVTGRSMPGSRLSQSWFYALVRHPISLGWMLVFWATPQMTLGHLVFALGMTLYIVAVTPMEERDISADLGEDYADCRSRVRAFVPLRRASPALPLEETP
jgi:protein-S-isoprenylcysteine O-methyltransferase Ste14